MNLSKFIVELYEISGLNEQKFCEKINIDVTQFLEIKSNTAQSSTVIKAFLKAISASLFSKKTQIIQNDEVHDELNQARAIIITVGEGEGLADHQQISLSIASSIIDKALLKIK
jgi:ethanolamine ammonia-lyase small subunit